MIQLTVKTLDSQNHLFSVPDDITVKQLKEKIAESVPVSADVQRLIYCGRVLQDDRNLSEYDVNGKVIHLVQRPPPSASRPNGTSPPRTATGARRGNRHPRVDGNAMYLGAMAFPADLMDAQGIQPPQPSHGLSQSRLNLASRMLNRAKRVLDKLENPTNQESPEPESPPEEMENVPGDNDDNPAATLVSTTVGLDASGIGIETDAFNSSIAQAAQAATAAAIAAAVSAAQGARLPNVTIMHGRQPPAEASVPQVNATSEPAENTETNADSSTNEPDANGASDRRRRRNVSPRTTVMADTLDELHSVQNRLQPFLQQYTRLMREDPSFESDTSGVQDSQRVFNLVSEVMHHIAHAYHAMSDIMCDFNAAPPRSLRCRPVLIQHSAVLQAGIPIQAQFNLTASRGSNTTANSESQSSEARSQSNASVNTQQEAGTQNSNSENGPQRAENRTSTSETETPSSQGNQNAHTATGTRRIFAAGGGFPPAAFNFSPGNVEVFMEVGPGSITIDSVEATIMGNNSSRNGDSTGSGRQGGGMPWGAPPPPDFIQNIMQAVAGHMMGHAHNVTEPSPASTQPGSTQPGSTQSGSSQSGSNTTQNSQARGNTATHPTTSTQTRSTSRPHVHFAPTAVQSLAATNFDPFLPCNSHHVKVSRRSRQRGAAPAFGRVSVDIHSRTVPAPSGTSRPPPPPPPVPPPPPPSANSHNQPQNQQQAPSQQRQAGGRREAAGQARSPADFFRFMESMMGSFPPTGRAFMASLSTQDSGSRPNVFVFNADDRGMQMPQVDSLFSLASLVSGLRSGGNLSTSMPTFQASGRNANGQSLTLADVLNCLSDHSYVEGQSLLTDLIMTLARNMTFEDVTNLNVDSEARRNSLNRLRPHLRDFVTRQLLSGQAVTESNMSQGAERLVSELVPHFNPLQGARVRDNVDVVASLVRYHQRRIPEILTIITTEGTDENFGQSCVSWCTQYAQQLVALIRHCCVDDEALEDTARTYMEQLTNGVHPIVRHWTVVTSLTRLQGYITHLNVPLEMISPFIVNRDSNPTPPASERIPLPAPANTTTNHTPMETEFHQVQLSEATIDVYTEMRTPITNGDVEPENIPLDVSVGSESWHSEVPNDWVPVITRDMHAQRRQSPQRPFSDAYLSGMPPKRRKVVTASKPQGNLTQMITETVRSAVEAGGISSVANTELISEAAGNDPLVQNAYREQVRTIVEDSLKINPDFSADRFPNTAKFFSKK